MPFYAPYMSPFNLGFFNRSTMMDHRGGDKLYHLAPLFSISVSANC